MEQELKQRLIGAAVITALAAIFVPMLFDNPVNDAGKNISALKIPEVPAKVQDVEITPLPEKVEDVVAQPPAEEASKPATVLKAPAEETVIQTPQTKPQLIGKEPQPVAAKHIKAPEPEPAPQEDDDMAAAEAVRPIIKSPKLPAQPAPITQTMSAIPPAPPLKTIKPMVKAQEAPLANNSAKSAEPAPVANETGTRLYLNVGSYTQKAHAFAMQDNLKQQGFPTTVKEIVTDKGPVFKVRVGPMLDKARVQAVKNKLTQININSFVTPDD
jgi:DedD protein